MNAEMPFLPASGSVTAKTSARSALRPEVMNLTDVLADLRMLLSRLEGKAEIETTLNANFEKMLARYREVAKSA